MKKYILLFVFICSISFVKGQQSMTLYSMDRVLQSHFLNPAMESPYRFQIGGLILPIAGQLPPSMYIGVSNSAFGFSDVLREGTGDKSDKLILDLGAFMKNIDKANHLKLNMDIELLSVGFMVKDRFFTVSITEKIRGGFSVPYDFFDLAINGNASYMRQNKPHDMSDLDANLTHYREFAFGGNIYSNDKLSLGARLKFISGKANAETSTNKLHLVTDPEDYKMSIIADMNMKFSLPFYFDYIEYDSDSISIEINEESKDAATAKNYLFNSANFGMGIDIGATYKLNEKIELFASINDLGFIKWKTNSQQFIINGTYDDFKGIPVRVEGNEIKFDDFFDNFIDSITTELKPELKEESYKTNLNANIYLGGKYKFHKRFNVGVIYRGDFYRKSYLQSLSFMLNADLTNWVSLHASYTMTNKTYLNFGAGVTLKAGPINWFIATDNFSSAIFPEKCRNINIRFGCNLVFGNNK